MTTVTRVDADFLELLAFESGKTIEFRPDHALLRLGDRVFRADLPSIPEQRKPVADE